MEYDRHHFASSAQHNIESAIVLNDDRIGKASMDFLTPTAPYC